MSAGSGEGKSTNAKPFVQAIERVQIKLDIGTQDQLASRAKTVVVKEQLNHLRAEVRRRLQEEKDTDDVQEQIARVLRELPESYAQPRLIYDNVTPAALRRGLASWPSALVVSMEAAHILNGSMGKAFPMLNAGWDGDPIRSDTLDDSFVAHSPRISTLLYLQPKPTLQYLARRGDDAHGSGLLARMDWAFLPSTKGSRPLPFTRGEKSSNSLAAYQARVEDLLETRIRARKAGHSDRRALGFSEPAVAYFNNLYARALAMQAPGEPMHGLGGYAAKIAERVSRYACIIHVFNDYPGLIGAETLYHAELIVQWHTRQFLSMLHLTSPQTQALQDGHHLGHLIWEAAQRGEMVRPADLSHICPVDWVRPRRNRALQVLCSTGQARIERWKQTRYVQLTSMPSLALNVESRDNKKPKKIS